MRKTRKLVAMSLVGTFFMLAAAGCSSSQPVPTAAAVETTVAADATEKADEEKTTVSANDGEKKIIGVAQCHLNTPSRVAVKTEMEQAIQEKGLNWEIILTDGQNNSAKQTSDVEDLIQRGVDCIIMAPVQSEPLAPVAKKVLDAGIPLILIDRMISTDDYTTFAGGDNKLIGVKAAEYIGEKLGGKGKVAMIEGTLGASATNDRAEGFLETLKEKYPDMELIADLSADYKRDQCMKVMEDLLQANEELDAVFCHSDNMALGALQAMEAAGRTQDIICIGADGQKEAFDKIIEGKLDVSIIYPMGGAEAIDLAEKIFAGEPVEKINLLDVPLVDKENVEEMYDKGF